LLRFTRLRRPTKTRLAAKPWLARVCWKKIGTWPTIKNVCHARYTY